MHNDVDDVNNNTKKNNYNNNIDNNNGSICGNTETTLMTDCPKNNEINSFKLQ